MSVVLEALQTREIQTPTDHHTHADHPHHHKKATRSGVVIAGASGAGKTTLANAFRAFDPDAAFLVSDTGRRPRAGDLGGKWKEYAYHPGQEGKDWFQLKKAADSFLWSIKFSDNWYATQKSSLSRVLESGELWFSHLVPEKVDELWKHTQAFVPIYLEVPASEVEAQLRRRADAGGEQEIQRRLHECEDWSAQAHSKDCPIKYHFVRGGQLRKPIQIALEVIDILRTQVSEEMLKPYLVLDDLDD